MSHLTSQQPFLFASILNSKRHCYGSVNTRSSSTVSSIGSIDSYHHGAHSFYNLFKDNNRSNIDLTQSDQYLRHRPYPSVHNHSNISSITINHHHASRGHSVYSMASGAGSSYLSLASSQFSVDRVNNAFGSLPPPCPVPSFSASSSSLPLVSSITTPKSKTLSSPSSLSLQLPLKRRSPPHSLGQRHKRQQHQQRQKYKQRTLSSTSSTSSEIPLDRTISSAASPSPSLRTHLLPSVGTPDQLPLPRKRISSTVPPPLDTKTLPVCLSPSSISAAMSLVSPCSFAFSSPPADETMYSDVFSVNGLASTTANRSPPIAAMAITELIISEAHYLIAIKGVANALNKATESTLAAGYKENVAVRSLIDRWTEMMRVHAKFCDAVENVMSCVVSLIATLKKDIVSVNENFRGVAARISSLLVSLEPMLVEHSRELPNSLKKLTHHDQNSEHTLAEWDLALRQPFEHLTSYDGWFQRIDPQSKFCKDYRSQLSGVIHKIKAATDANPQSHNMPQRLSIVASGVVRRRSSAQTLSSSSSAPQTPTTPDTPSSVYSTDASSIPSPIVDKAVSCQSVESSSLASLPMPEMVRDLAVTDHAMATDTVMEPASSSDVRNNDQKQPEEKESPAIPTTADSDMKEPSALIANTFLAPVHPARQPQYHSSTSPGLSSSRTLAIETSRSMATSSASPVYSKSSSSVEILQGKPTASTTSSLSKQTFLAENENRKAKIRIGTSVAIKAKAESLQPPTYATKTAIESLRKIPPVKNVVAKKPPVKSLISFWEQVKVSNPLDA